MLDKETCISKMLEIHSKGLIITERLLNESYETYGLSRACIKKHFGSMNNAKKELAIPITMNRNTKEDAIFKIKFLNNKYGHFSKQLTETLNIKNEPMNINSKTIVRIWGSFENMYKELTELTRDQRGIVKSESELISELERLNKEFGFVNSGIIANFGKYSYDCYIRRWKTPKNIFNAANVNYKERQWNGQKTIIDFIEKSLNEESTKEKKFEWLRGYKNRPLRIDAFFEKYNLAVEYNGAQHYKFVDRFHKTEEGFNISKERDQLKYKLLKENNINFNYTQILRFN